MYGLEDRQSLSDAANLKYLMIDADTDREQKVQVKETFFAAVGTRINIIWYIGMVPTATTYHIYIQSDGKRGRRTWIHP